MHLLRSALVILGLAASTSAFSQDYVFQDFSSSIALGQMLEANRDAMMETVESDPTTIRPRSKASNQSLTYRPSSARTKANLQNFVEKSRRGDPQGAAQLEQLFATRDVIGEMGVAMRSVGLDKNNVADAYALYWINAWSAAYADFDPTSQVTAQAVASQAAVGLSQSPEFARATDAQKQEMAEALILQGALVESAMQSAKNDPALLRQVGQAVMQGAKAMGLDLDRMTLTEDGFVPSNKGSDAGAVQDATDPAAADKALATNNDDEDGGLSVAQIAMIAAAGGAGLGAVLLLGRASGRNS